MMTRECLITARRDELMKMLDDKSLTSQQRGKVVELIRHCHKILFTLKMLGDDKSKNVST